MSIEKYRPEFEDGKLKHQSKPYALILNSVLQNCKNLEALALWCYLQSQHENWQLSFTNIKNHFEIGRDKYYKILKYLIDSNLIERTQSVDEKGIFGKTEYLIKNGEDFIMNQGFKESSPLPDLPHTDLPHTVKQHTINKRYNINTNKKHIEPSDRKQRRSAIHENFEPTPEHVSLAIELNVDLVEQVKRFIDHYIATGKTMIKWDAAFRNWLRKASDFKKSSATARVTYQNKNEIKSTVPDFVPTNLHKRSSKTVVAANMEKIRKKLGSVLRETK